MIQAIAIDLSQPGHALLAAVAADRIRAFATQHDETTDPQALTATAMIQLWQRKPDVHVIVLTDPEKGVVGHLLAQMQGSVVVLVQAKADGDVGDAMKQAIVDAEAWGASRGATVAMFVTHRNAEAMKRWNPGYKVARTVFTKPLDGSVS